LHNYLGMIGIPIDLHPDFPAAASTVLLTESASADPEIVAKIKRQLMDGKVVIITSGLLGALRGKGIEDIVELRTSNRKATASDFLVGRTQVYSTEQPITVPQIDYLTNDSWEVISCLVGVTGTPLLHSAKYGNSTLYVLTIPDSYDDLYRLPAEVLSIIRRIVTRDLPVRLDAPSQVMLFVYDNDSFIVHSLRSDASEVGLVVDERIVGLMDLISREELSEGEAMIDERGNPIQMKRFSVTIEPHSFRVFRAT
jgi:hypothetical protein